MGNPDRLKNLKERCKNTVKLLSTKVPEERLVLSVITVEKGRKMRPVTGQNIAYGMLSKFLRDYEKLNAPEGYRVEFFEEGGQKTLDYCEENFSPTEIHGTVLARSEQVQEQPLNGFEGLGAAEIGTLVEQKSSQAINEFMRRHKEEEMMKELEAVKKERDTHATRVQELESADAARNKVQEWSQLAGTFGPVVGALFPAGHPIGQALSGLGSVQTAAQHVSDAAKTIPDLVHDFTAGLESVSQETLLKIFQFIEKDHGLIPRILSSVEKSETQKTQ